MAFQGDSIFWVEVEKVVPNPYQPRREFDEGKLKELSESVRMYGILQPLTVTRKEIQTDDGAFRTEYELIAGERRLRASKLAGLQQVPVIIRENDDTEQEKLELAIIENLQREDLNAVDRALAFQQLADTFSLTHDQVAKKVGRSRMYVSNTIRLLGLPDYMLESLKVADISEGHARTLLMLKDRPEEQDVVYREILLKKLSVREVERIVRKIATDKVRKKNWKGTDPHLIEIEKEFTDALGTRVQIAKTDYGGKLTIDYFSEDDLQKLLRLMRKQDEERKNAQNNESGGSSPMVQTMAAVTAATPLEVVEEEPEVAKVDEGGAAETETREAPVGENESSEQPYSSNSFSNVTQSEEDLMESEPAADKSLESPRGVADEGDFVNPFAAALDAAEDETTELEDSVIEAANEAGESAFRPTQEEKVELSAAARNEVEEQIEELVEHEVSHTPTVNNVATESVQSFTPQTTETVNKETAIEDPAPATAPTPTPTPSEDVVTTSEVQPEVVEPATVTTPEPVEEVSEAVEEFMRQESTESAAQPESVPVPEPTPAVTAEKKDDDSDLYSMRNFSI